MTAAFWHRSMGYLIRSLQCLLAAGLPLVFTLRTHSVFEMNKLTLLRICTVLLLALGVVEYLWQRIYPRPIHEYAATSRHKKNKKPVPPPSTVNAPSSGELAHLNCSPWIPKIFVGLLMAWCVSLLLSTLFGANPWVALIGSYDRWEGLWTQWHYAALLGAFVWLTRSPASLRWMLASLALGASGSSLFGLAQYFGYDVSGAHWTLEVTQRIFGLINNPVHFSAYSAMMFPVLAGLYLAALYDRRPWAMTWQSLLLAAATLTYLMVFFSFSRAAWLGLMVSVTYAWIHATHAIGDPTRQNVWIDFVLTLPALAAWFLISVFRIYTSHLSLAVLAACLLVGYGAALFFLGNDKRTLLLRLCIFLMVGALVSVPSSWTYLLAYLACLAAVIFLSKNSLPQARLRYGLLALGLVLALAPTIFSLPQWLADLSPLAKGSVRNRSITSTIQEKSASLGDDPAKHSSRPSMLRTGIRGWMDGPRNMLIGTGPGTIRYVFPKYKGPEYHQVEGHYESIADNLHNEYINTLLTGGILGLCFWLGLLGLGLYALCAGLGQHWQTPARPVLSGLLGGSLVFLAQSNFNFGTAATKGTFYIFLALGIAGAIRPEIWGEGDAECGTRNAEQKTILNRLFHIPHSTFRIALLCVIAILTLGLLYLIWIPWRADAYYNRGLDLHARANAYGSSDLYQLCLTSLTQAADLFPLETEYRFELGRIYYEVYKKSPTHELRQGALTQARNAYERCLKYQPQNPWYLTRISAVMQRLAALEPDPGAHEDLMIQAENYSVRSSDADPLNPLFLVDAGYLKHQRGKLDEALAYYDRALAIEPNIKQIWVNKANALGTLGRMHEAEAIRKEINDRTRALAEKADSFYQQGNLRMAAMTLAELVHFAPDMLDIRMSLAAIYIQIGGNNLGDAELQYQAVLERNPRHTLAQQGLERLRRQRLKDLGNYSPPNLN